MARDLPDSGEPGVAPPAPGSLPRPRLWPTGAGEAPFVGAEEDTATPPSSGRRRLAWVAVALMVLGVLLVGLAVVVTSWLPLVAGVVVGLVGCGLAWRAQIMEDVTVSDSPHGG